MVNIKTVIDELNTGKIKFTSNEDVCSTEGEVVIHLERLKELDTAARPYNPEDAMRRIACPYCGSDKFLFNRNGERNKRCGYCGKSLAWD